MYSCMATTTLTEAGPSWGRLAADACTQAGVGLTVVPDLRLCRCLMCKKSSMTKYPEGMQWE